MSIHAAYPQAMAELAVQWGVTTIAVGAIIVLLEAAAVFSAVVCLAAGSCLIAAGFIFKAVNAVVIREEQRQQATKGAYAAGVLESPRTSCEKRIKIALELLGISRADGFTGALCNGLSLSEKCAIEQLGAAPDLVLPLLNSAIAQLPRDYYHDAANIAKHVMEYGSRLSLERVGFAINLMIRSEIDSSEMLNLAEVHVLMRTIMSLTRATELLQRKILAPHTFVKAVWLCESAVRSPEKSVIGISWQRIWNCLFVEDLFGPQSAEVSKKLLTQVKAMRGPTESWESIPAYEARELIWNSLGNCSTRDNDLLKFLRECQGFDAMIQLCAPKYGESMPQDLYDDLGYQQALTGYEALIQQQPPSILHAIARAQRRSLRDQHTLRLSLDQALRIFHNVSAQGLRTAIQTASCYPDDPMPYIWDALMEQKLYEDAVRMFGRCTRLPSNSTWLEVLAHSHQKLQNYAKRLIAMDEKFYWFPQSSALDTPIDAKQGWSLLGLRHMYTFVKEEMRLEHYDKLFRLINQALSGLDIMFMEIDHPLRNAVFQEHPFGLIRLLRALSQCFDSDALPNSEDDLLHRLHLTLEQYKEKDIAEDLPTSLIHVVQHMMLSDILAKRHPSALRLDVLKGVYEFSQVRGDRYAFDFPGEVTVRADIKGAFYEVFEVTISQFESLCRERDDGYVRQLWRAQLGLLTGYDLSDEPTCDQSIDAIMQRIEQYLNDSAAHLALTANDL